MSDIHQKPLEQEVKYDMESHLIYGYIAIRNGWDMFEFLFFQKKYFFIYLIAFLLFILLMILWKNYNYQEFGKLHRRTFQPPVGNDELCEMFELDASIIEQMQGERYVLLEKNIIPADLGMGKEKETKER